jgi:hypothetical protein
MNFVGSAVYYLIIKTFSPGKKGSLFFLVRITGCGSTTRRSVAFITKTRKKLINVWVWESTYKRVREIYTGGACGVELYS